MAWTIKNSERKQVDRFGVTIDQVILPNGEEKTFSYLDFAKGVCVLPITKKKEIVCLRQYRHAVNQWQWELPAGMIDEGFSPMETARKELEEETGFQAETWIDLGSFYPSPGSTAEEIYLFAATELKASTQKLEASEQIELHTLPLEEVQALVKSGEFKHGAGLAVMVRYMLHYL